MSNSFSAVIRIAKDAEIKTLASGHEVLNFRGANNVGFGDKQITMWINIAYWRKADALLQYLTKGAQVFVTGELTLREYQSNGETRTSLELNTTSIDLIGSKKDGGTHSEEPEYKTEQRKKDEADFNDDIPF